MGSLDKIKHPLKVVTIATPSLDPKIERNLEQTTN